MNRPIVCVACVASLAGLIVFAGPLAMAQSVVIDVGTDGGNDTLIIGGPGSIIFTVDASGNNVAALSFPFEVGFTGGNMIGPISDRFGRRRLLVAGMIITGIGFLGYGISTSFAMLIGFSIIIGIGSSAVFPNTLASIGDYFPVEKRGRITGIVLLGITIAVVAGIPVEALIANRFGWHWSFISLGILFFIIAIAFSIVLPQSRQDLSSPHISYISMIWNAFRNKQVVFLFMINMLIERGSLF